jgi:hypothetical protein
VAAFSLTPQIANDEKPDEDAKDVARGLWEAFLVFHLVEIVDSRLLTPEWITIEIGGQHPREPVYVIDHLGGSGNTQQFAAPVERLGRVAWAIVPGVAAEFESQLRRVTDEKRGCERGQETRTYHPPQCGPVFLCRQVNDQQRCARDNDLFVDVKAKTCQSAENDCSQYRGRLDGVQTEPEKAEDDKRCEIILRAKVGDLVMEKPRHTNDERTPTEQCRISSECPTNVSHRQGNARSPDENVNQVRKRNRCANKFER